MKFSTFFSVVLLAVSVNCRDIVVTNSEELTSALKLVNLNDTIHLQDGIYNGNFVINRNGNFDLPITLTGSKNAILISSTYGLHIYNVINWILRGFTVQNSTKGIVFENSYFNILDNVHVHNTDEEGIVIIGDSMYNAIQNCNIHDTGRKNATKGIGISIGLPINEWLNGIRNWSDYNILSNNTIGPNIPVECVDVKEGAVAIGITGNYFDSATDNGKSYSDSTISIKGSRCRIENNISDNSRLFGFKLTTIAGAPAACTNVIQNNKCKNLPADGECAINRSTNCENTVNNNEQV